MKGPAYWRSLAPLTDHLCFKPVLSIGGSQWKCERWIAIDRDKPAPWFQATGNPVAHGSKFVTISRVIEQIRGDDKIIFLRRRQVSCISDPIVDPLAMLFFLAASQFDHPGRQ